MRRFSNLYWIGGLILAIFLSALSISLQVSWSDWQKMAFSPNLLVSDFTTSFLRVTAAALAAAFFGIIGGYLLRYFPKFEQCAAPLIHFVRHISPFAWLPFAILWFGLGEFPIAFILFITLFFPMLVGSHALFSEIEQAYLDEACVCGAGFWQMFWYVELPLTGIGLLNLFRIHWGLGWATVVAAEMLGVQSGLGFRLLDFRYLLQYPQMLVYFMAMGVGGVGVDLFLQGILRLVKKRFL